MAFDSVQDYTLSSVLPISQPGFASNLRRVQDEDDGDDALDSVPTPAQGLKRPEPVSEGGVEDNTSDEDEEVPSIGRPASTPQPPIPKPTSPVPGRSADGGTQKHTTASIRPKPTPQTKHSETPIHDNIFFRVARILLAVAVVMAVLYLVYWVATNVYGVDVLGWTRVFSREGEGESGMSASIPSAEQAFTADVPSLMVQESTSTTAPEVRTPTTGNTADVDSSPSSALFKSIGALFGSSGTAAAASAATSAASAASGAPLSWSETYPTGHVPSHTLPPHVSPYHHSQPQPQAPHAFKVPAAHTTPPRADHVAIRQGSDPPVYDQSIPLDNRRADELLDMLARME